MLKHRALVAEFLQTNYDKFFKHYADLLQTKNYATLRQALKLLSELLLGSLGFSMKIFDFLRLVVVVPRVGGWNFH